MASWGNSTSAMLLHQKTHSTFWEQSLENKTVSYGHIPNVTPGISSHYHSHMICSKCIMIIVEYKKSSSVDLFCSAWVGLCVQLQAKREND